jgi:hypothetical protein
LLNFPKKKPCPIAQRNQSVKNLSKGNQSAFTLAQLLLNDVQNALPKKFVFRTTCQYL